MFIIVGREIPLKNSTPSKNNPAPSFLDPMQDPFSVFCGLVGRYNPVSNNNQKMANPLGGAPQSNPSSTYPNPFGGVKK